MPAVAGGGRSARFVGVRTVRSLRTAIARHVYPFYETRLRGRGTFTHLAAYERQQWWPAEQVRALQLQKLQALLRHCQLNVPYWTERLRALHFDWRDLRSLSDLRALPLLDKSDIRANGQRMVARNHAHATLRKTTSGSTGEPFAFEYTRESHERRTAVALRGYRWAGADLGTRRFDLWGVDPGRTGIGARLKQAAFDAVWHRRVASAFRLDEAALARHARDFEAYRPDVLVGYTGALTTFADWVRSHGGLAWRPRSVIAAAELLTEDGRRHLASTFGAPVFNTYGSREFMLIGAECAEHDGLHVNDDHLVVEVVDATGAPVEDGIGEIVVTDLHNEGMPLVRYRIGDVGVADPGTSACACGRGLGRIRSVQGRRLDMLRAPDGSRLPGTFFPFLLKDVPGIVQFQVRQRALDAIVLRIKPGPAWSEASAERIRRGAVPVLGTGVRLTFELTDALPVAASGKRLVSINELDEPAHAHPARR